MSIRSLGSVFASFLVCLALRPATSDAQVLALTAKSANVADAGTAVKVNILRWSTEEERKPVVVALDPAAQESAKTAASDGARGARGAQGGRGALDPNDPALADLVAAQGRGGRGAGGAGGGGGGGRGGRGDAPSAKPPDPISTLTSALTKAPTVGYLWTNEVVGYSIKYAYRAPLPGGGERIILATDRRLGAGTAGWKLAATVAPTDYEFTLIEIRMDAKGLGEGKTSLTSKVILDNEAKTLALDNYASTPAILQNVKR